MDKQKVIISGSKNITDYNNLLSALGRAVETGIIHDLTNIMIISRGALEKNIEIEEIKPKYINEYDKSALLKRNIKMARKGDVLIVVWNGKSRGTKLHILCESEILSLCENNQKKARFCIFHIKNIFL